VGVTVGDETVAYSLEFISGDATAQRATNVEIAGTPLVVFWTPGQSSALEDDSLSGGRDVGTVGVFESTVDGQVLTFLVTADGFADQETGTSWNLGGEAIVGPLAGSRLERIRHLDTFWFAWATYSPGTELIEGP
jgi:hypothetical protein